MRSSTISESRLPRAEQIEPVNLEKQRLLTIASRAHDRWIVALEVPYLQDFAPGRAAVRSGGGPNPGRRRSAFSTSTSISGPHQLTADLGVRAVGAQRWPASIGREVPVIGEGRAAAAASAARRASISTTARSSARSEPARRAQ